MQEKFACKLKKSSKMGASQKAALNLIDSINCQWVAPIDLKSTNFKLVR